VIKMEREPFKIICIDGVTFGLSEAEYHKSLADPEDGVSAGGGGGWCQNTLLIVVSLIILLLLLQK
jgi:hypothetical protein